jgi:hypothetical protein
MGNYYSISVKIGTQTKKYTLISKITTPEVHMNFQEGRHRQVGISSGCYQMGIYHPILLKIGTQTKKQTCVLQKSQKRKLTEKAAKIKCKNDIVLKRQRCMSAKL